MNTPTPYAELTQEQQTELIFAKASGASIELWCPGLGEWCWTRNPMFLPDCAYRIMPFKAD